MGAGGAAQGSAPELILISAEPQLPRVPGRRRGPEEAGHKARLGRSARASDAGCPGARGAPSAAGTAALRPPQFAGGQLTVLALCVHTANSQVGGGETAQAVSCPRVEATKEEREEGGKEGGRAGDAGTAPSRTPGRPSGR